jgi:hypothetical protein
MHDDQLDRLAAEVSAAGLSRPDLESLLFRLSGQQRRLFLRLVRGPADTVEVRTACSVGNISECAAALNAKLAAVGDDRRVVCQVKPHVNAYGERGSLGLWQLVRGGGERRAA